MTQYQYSKEVLKKGHDVSFKALGYSMKPTIQHLEEVYLKPFNRERDTLNLYDIVFAEVDGIFILHRIIELGEWIVLKGDHDKTIHRVSLDHIYGIYMDIHYVMRCYLLNQKIPNITLSDLKRHNLEGLYGDTRSLKQAYQMTLKDQEAFNVLAILSKEFNKIILLKGYALEDIYVDKPYIRAKGDLDIYVKSNHQKIGAHLIELGFKLKDTSIKHDSYHNHLLSIELHYMLDEGFELEDHMLMLDTKTQCYRLNNSYQLIYLLLHIKKHIRHGGIGYKHILDIYYLKDFKDYRLLTDYQVDMLFTYITSLMDLILGNKVTPEIDMKYLLLFASDIKRYGVHGSMDLRVSKLKDTNPLLKRYLSKSGFQRLIETIKHNSLKSMIKKLTIYLKSKKNVDRKLLYKELGI